MIDILYMFCSAHWRAIGLVENMKSSVTAVDECFFSHSIMC